jgi:hypothetical protein
VVVSSPIDKSYIGDRHESHIWIKCVTDDRNIVIYVHIQCNSIVWEIVVTWYCLMMALWAETCSKIQPLNSFYTGNVNEILIIVVLWRTIKESKKFTTSCLQHSNGIKSAFVSLNIYLVLSFPQGCLLKLRWIPKDVLDAVHHCCRNITRDPFRSHHKRRHRFGFWRRFLALGLSVLFYNVFDIVIHDSETSASVKASWLHVLLLRLLQCKSVFVLKPLKYGLWSD